MELWIIWLIAAGVLVVIEMLTLTLYMLWLAIGAAVAAVIALFLPDNYAVQIAVGGLISLLLTIYTKPITRRIRSGRGYKDAIDQLVGREGLIVEPIRLGQPGIVRVGHETWSATSNRELPAGSRVTVIGRGTTLLEVRLWEGES